MARIGPIKIDFTDFWHPNTCAAKEDSNLYKLLSQRFDLEICSDPDFVIYSCFGRNFLRYKCVRIFYTGENLRPSFSECDYAFSFDYPLTARNYRLPLYRLDDTFSCLMARRDPEQALRQKTSFCNFIYNNPLPCARRRFFHKLNRYRRVDAPGPVLNNIGSCIEPGYHNKLEFMKPYKFSIAFENHSHPGYTTEKLVHALVTNTLAIYWGNPVIDRDFNTCAFINCHEFRSFDDVIQRVIEVDKDDELYRSYLAEPVFTNNVPNEYVDDNNILERFGTIFGSREIIPVAQTGKQLLATMNHTKAAYLLRKLRRRIRDWQPTCR